MIGRSKCEEKELKVSHQTIYNFIYRPNLSGLLTWLIGKSENINGKNIENIKKINIINRGNMANGRKETEHYEINTIHLDQGGILTMVDRKSRFLSAALWKDLSTPITTQAMIKLITDLGRRYGKVKSITSDNGGEFWGHKELKKRFTLDYYHCDLYCSWQRGTNENTKWILRRYFPKRGNSYQNITNSHLDNVVHMINYRARKILNFLNPYEVISKKFISLFSSC